MSNFNMDDYVPVADRIAAFYAKFPDGSIQSELVELSDSRVIMRAYAYRSAEDPRPGVGYSSLSIPGSTPYTRGSEVENAETSAWGRAIAALGFEVKKGVATAEDVRNKTDDRPARPAQPVRPHVVDTSVPDEPEWLDDGTLVRDDLTTCPIHGVAWAGQPGDLWHKDAEGKYCRHPDNVRKARAR